MALQQREFDFSNESSIQRTERVCQMSAQKVMLLPPLLSAAMLVKFEILCMALERCSALQSHTLSLQDPTKMPLAPIPASSICVVLQQQWAPGAQLCRVVILLESKNIGSACHAEGAPCFYCVDFQWSCM